MKIRHTLALTVAAGLVLAACGEDSVTNPGLTRAEVAGTYGLTVLTFDPQGSLPEVNLLSRITLQTPTLQLTSNGVAQLSYRDPDTNLLVTANGSFTTTVESVRIDFGEGDAHEALLLSRQMSFDYRSAGAVTLEHDRNDATVSRARLLELAPEFEGEQLFDPVPGRLRVTFRK